MSYKSKKAKATDISNKVKKIVWERDEERCIFCGNHYAMPNAHVIPRSKGGLGIEHNVVTACLECHFKMDQTSQREEYLKIANEYLKSKYGQQENCTYGK